MRQRDKAEKLRGAGGFDAFYGELFGGRWQRLKDALLAEGVHVELRYGQGEPYFLDPASVCAALCLPVRGAGRVLDLCAAPGGKTLVLAGNLDDGARLCSNERSSGRTARLSKVVAQTLPPELAGRVDVSCSDGATWCRRETECFDSILLDAPCSSERHLLQDSKYLDGWSPARVKSLAVEQWALLSSAWRLLAPGGSLLYATCALAPAENDGVLERLAKKCAGAEFASPAEMERCAAGNAETFSGALAFPSGLSVPALLAAAERTAFGLQLLPDSASGTGPLFFSLMRKRAAEDAAAGNG
ncbi:MAG TPA: RNA methyltransferase [Treponema sp.]|nr:RNA methyltransferase [Treponema sp.]